MKEIDIQNVCGVRIRTELRVTEHGTSEKFALILIKLKRTN
jgi:hypothetical protein